MWHTVGEVFINTYMCKFVNVWKCVYFVLCKPSVVHYAQDPRKDGSALATTQLSDFPAPRHK